MQAEFFIPIVANIGLLAILAWIVSFFGSTLFASLESPDVRSRIIIGLTFGIGAALLIEIPVELQEGIIGDGRGAPILLSGIIGGPIAAAITGLIAAAMRAYVGGAGATTGVLYVFCFAAFGCLWRWIAARKQIPSVHWAWLIAVSTVATVVTIPTVYFIPESAQMMVLKIIWPQLWIANVIGSLILGSLINRERIRVEMEQELIEKEKRATAGTEAKSRFLAAMSHEIRTPINAILGVLQLLQQKLKNEDDQRDVRTGMDAGNALLSLVGQVLDFAKIEAGVVSVQKEKVCINTLFHDLSSMFSNLARERGVEIQFHDSLPERTVVNTDPAKIHQILFNLIGNALKFAEEGKVDVTVRSAERTVDGLFLEFEVQDTGPGIAPEDHDLIFEEFGQSESGKRVTGGSGLGLSISRRLARELGGDISVQSRVGHGAVFKLSLTAETVLEMDFPENDIPVSNTESIGTVRVLLAEDNDINRQLAIRMLEADGHDVESVVNGLEAVEAVTTDGHCFDIVFMDIQMPEMDGDEATRVIIDRMDEGKRPPIVALTANALTEQMEDYRRAGMVDVLTKPVRIPELRQMIQLYARRKSES